MRLTVHQVLAIIEPESALHHPHAIARWVGC